MHRIFLTELAIRRVLRSPPRFLWVPRMLRQSHDVTRLGWRGSYRAGRQRLTLSTPKRVVRRCRTDFRDMSSKAAHAHAPSDSKSVDEGLKGRRLTTSTGRANRPSWFSTSTWRKVARQTWPAS